MGRRASPEVLRVVHVASFTGNLGDYVNHSSFQRWLETLISPTKLEIARIELREVWNSDRDLFGRLLRHCATSDLVVLGGGNFWETWDPHSESGTSLNLTYDQLKALGTPVFFNALGVEIARGITEKAAQFFAIDFPQLLSDPEFFVSVRNDGALDNLKQLAKDVEGVVPLPDHGLFYEIGHAEIVKNSGITLNLATDMQELRYGNFDSVDEFFREMAESLEAFRESQEFHLDFVAHVPSDITAFERLSTYLSSSFVRHSTSLLWQNNPSRREDFIKPYLENRVTVAQRFHANVLAIKAGSRLISVSNHPQLTKFHQEMRTQHQYLLPLWSSEDFISFRERLPIIWNSREDADYALGLNKSTAERNLAADKLLIWLESQDLI